MAGDLSSEMLCSGIVPEVWRNHQQQESTHPTSLVTASALTASQRSTVGLDLARNNTGKDKNALVSGSPNLQMKEIQICQIRK
jgi:hypothetical protein